MDSYRSLLEVLKWASPEDALRHSALVSTQWNRSSISEELWQTFCDSADRDPRDFPSHRDRFRCCRKPTSVALFSSGLHLLNLATETWSVRPFSQPPVTDRSASWAFAPACGGYICCGGDCEDSGNTLYSAAAMVVAFTGEVRTLPALRIPRKHHGMAVFAGVCYVFGGIVASGSSEQVTSTGERLDLQSLSQWDETPEMLSPRSKFNPCIRIDRIYLMGGMTKSCEVFDPTAQVFAPIPLVLPPFPSTTFLYNDRLVTITGREETTYCVDSGETGKRQWRCFVPYGSCCPVVDSQVCWFAHGHSGYSVMKVNIDTLASADFSPPHRAAWEGDRRI